MTIFQPFAIAVLSLASFVSAGSAETIAQAIPEGAPPIAKPEEPAPPGSISGAIKMDDGVRMTPDEDMARVLDALQNLAPKPIETLSPEEARRQAGPADAAKAVLKEAGKGPAQSGVRTRDLTYPGAAGALPVRVYTPPNQAQTPSPIVVYFHGGGWVIGGIDAYDAGARALARKTSAIVIAPAYRQAPEHKFPAAHDDAFAAYQWAAKNAQSLGGDPQRIAVAGESAGGNLAVNVAVAARDRKAQQPLHMLLIYPVAGADMNTPSYAENAKAAPLSKAMMEWFFRHAFADEKDRANPMIDLVGKADLRDLPDATVITAEIDPLRSEGELLAEKLTEGGSKVKYENFRGAAHEFFGMDAVVKDAAQAQDFAAGELKSAFAAEATGTTPRSGQRKR